MAFSEDEMMISPIEPPDCDGGFSSIECAGVATKQISIDIPSMGTWIAYGTFCDPCAAEVQKRLTTPDDAAQRAGKVE